MHCVKFGQVKGSLPTLISRVVHSYKQEYLLIIDRQGLKHNRDHDLVDELVILSASS